MIVRQAIYRKGRWVTATGVPIPQAKAWEAWMASRPPGHSVDKPRERSVVTIKGGVSVGGYKPTAADRAARKANTSLLRPPPDPTPKASTRKRSPFTANELKENRRSGVDAATERYLGKSDLGDAARESAGIAPSAWKTAEYFAQDAENIIRGFPAGVVNSVRHPIRSLEQMPAQIRGDFDPDNHRPVAALLDILSVLTLGASGSVRGVAGAGARTEARAAGASRAGALRSAATRAGAEGGGLLHAPRAGTYPLTMGDDTVYKPLSQGILYRDLFQKPRLAAVQRGLDKGSKLPKPLRGTLSAQATYGRVARAEQRILDDVRAAPLGPYAKATHKLPGPIAAAVNVVHVEGAHALANPAEAVARHIKFHEGVIARLERKMAVAGPLTRRGKVSQRAASPAGKVLKPRSVARLQTIQRDLDAQKQYVENLRASEQVLVEQPAKFTEALAQSRSLSAEAEQKLIAGKHLDPVRAEARKAKIARLYGSPVEGVPEGSSYFSLAPRYTRTQEGGMKTTATASTGTSRLGVSPPSVGARVGGLGKEFSGKALEKVVPFATDVVGQRARAVYQLEAATKRWNQLYKAGSPHKQRDGQVAIVEDSRAKSALRDALHEAEQSLLHGGATETALVTYRQRMKEAYSPPVFDGLPVGAREPGVRWVDRAAIKDAYASTGSLEPLMLGFDALNDVARATTLFARPAYALNALGNAAMGLAEKNVRYPPAVRNALHIQSRYGPDITAKTDALVGETKTSAYTVPTGFTRKISKKMADKWNPIVDLWHRRAMVLEEARSAGFGGDKYPDLFLPENEKIMVEVGQRARKASVDFNSMTPPEQMYARRITYFYGWMSRGSAWTARQPGEHPVMTTAQAQIGQQGDEELKRLLGNLPDWASRIPFIPVGEAKGGLQPVLNAASVYTPSTAVDVGAAAVDTAKGVAGLPHTGEWADSFTPALSVLLSSAGPSDPRSRSGLPGLLESHPIGAAVRRARGQGSKTYPDTGIGAALKPLLGGGMAPRNLSLTSAHEQADREHMASLSPDKRVVVRFQRWSKKATAATLKLGYDPAKQAKLERLIERSLSERQSRYENYAKLKIKDGPGYQTKALKADLDLLVSQGKLTKKQHANVLAYTASRSEAVTAKIRRQLGERYFGTEFLSIVTATVRKKTGVDLRLPR